MTSKMPAEGTNPIECPHAVWHVWLWFCQLSASRQHGFNGPQPIAYQEMLAFFQLEGVDLDGWELAAIHLLDVTAMNHSA